MSDTLSKLEQTEISKGPFGSYEEEAIISLALDIPEFFSSVGRFITPDMFARPECKLLIAEILNSFEKYNVIPTRSILRDKIASILTEDDPYQQVLDIVDRKSNHREIPIIKDNLLKWAKYKAFGLLYSEESQNAYMRGDYEYLEKILNNANRIADVGSNGFWFFDNYQLLFEESVIDHRTTGFPKLDKMLNGGGPSKKEVVCWLAPTNVGKSILLCNNAISSLKGIGDSGQPGQDVLLITFELDTIKTAMRCLGVIGKDIPIDQITEKKDYISRLIETMKTTYNKRFLIVEWAPEECSVNNIYALLDNLRRTDGWHPDVLIIDYLDLMISRNDAHNSDDYIRQKNVSSQIRGLAINENLLIFTATQTNRSAAGGTTGVADTTQVADSFGKQFALDYIISLNQSKNERSATPPRMRMYIAKNRNGPKNEIIDCTITYETMLVRESES